MFSLIKHPRRLLTLCLVFTTLVLVNFKCDKKRVVCEKEKTVPLWEVDLDFTNFDNELGTSDGRYVVPNYVHFIQFGDPELTFPQAVCILSALKHQRPEKLFIHTDLDGFKGKYWDVLINTRGFKEVLIVEKIKMPTEIFNQSLQKEWAVYHGGDITRMEVLMKYGGIYLDTDSYVVRSLNDLRRYECTLGWRRGKLMGNQIVLAHRNSRFLKLWYESYRGNYNPKKWYFNTGRYPSRNILQKMPYLVHRVEKLLGIYGIRTAVYTTKFTEWRDYYGFHLMVNRLDNLKNVSKTATYPVKFDDVNVLQYPVGFRSLCLDVYPFPEDVVKNLKS